MKSLLMTFLFICVFCTKTISHNDEFTDMNNDDGSITHVEGEIMIKEYKDISFSEVDLKGNYDLKINKSSEPFMKISGPEEEFELLDIQVSSKRLFIHRDDKKGDTPKITVLVNSVNPIVKITSLGVINCTFDENKQDNLSININGTGIVDAFDLEVERCDATVIGTIQCNVNVSKKLNVSLVGVANLSYKGTPEVEKSIVGLGSITHISE